MTAYRPIEPWQSKDGDIWTRRYMAAQGGGGYVRQATVNLNTGVLVVHVYRRAARIERVKVCEFRGGTQFADRIAVQPVRLARMPWLIGQKLKGVGK